MLIALKTSILQSGQSQRRVAQLTQIAESRLSTIVRGWCEATDVERQRLADVLHQPAEVLFSDNATVEIRG